MSRTGLGYQASQNGTACSAQTQNSAYHRFGSHVETKPQEAGFFDSIDTSLTGNMAAQSKTREQRQCSAIS